MISELEPIFKKYEAFAKQLDGVFEQVREQHAGCVNCKPDCSDCCYALFDLSLVEALYINRQFMEKGDAERRSEILDVASQIDRKTYQLKRKAFKAVAAGEKSEQQVLLEMAAVRISCPLLNRENRCELYEYRPITCRLYGIPTAIGGRGHTCGLSGFKEGTAYPTVNMDSIHARLNGLSQEIVVALRSSRVKMADLLMPLSMALLTVFDETYLGIAANEKMPEENQD